MHFQIIFFNPYIQLLPKHFPDKTPSKKVKEANQDIKTIGDKVQRKQDVTSVASTNNLVAPTPVIPQPKIDATDRKQIEAQNEDKSHTTKEALDDIKRTHYKEKRKKEQNIMEQYQSESNAERWVNIIYIL